MGKGAAEPGGGGVRQLAQACQGRVARIQVAAGEQREGGWRGWGRLHRRRWRLQTAKAYSGISSGPTLPHRMGNSSTATAARLRWNRALRSGVRTSSACGTERRRRQAAGGSGGRAAGWRAPRSPTGVAQCLRGTPGGLLEPWRHRTCFTRPPHSPLPRSSTCTPSGSEASAAIAARASRAAAVAPCVRRPGRALRHAALADQWSAGRSERDQMHEARASSTWRPAAACRCSSVLSGGGVQEHAAARHSLIVQQHTQARKPCGIAEHFKVGCWRTIAIAACAAISPPAFPAPWLPTNHSQPVGLHLVRWQNTCIGHTASRCCLLLSCSGPSLPWQRCASRQAIASPGELDMGSAV